MRTFVRFRTTAQQLTAFKRLMIFDTVLSFLYSTGIAGKSIIAWARNASGSTERRLAADAARKASA